MLQDTVILEVHNDDGLCRFAVVTVLSCLAANLIVLKRR